MSVTGAPAADDAAADELDAGADDELAAGAEVGAADELGAGALVGEAGAAQAASAMISNASIARTMKFFRTIQSPP